VVPRKTGMNSERTMSTLIAFIAEMPAAWSIRPSALMTNAENAK